MSNEPSIPPFAGIHFIDMLAEGHEDVEYCEKKALGNKRPDFWRRCYFRSSFALIEGMVSSAKHVYITEEKRGKIKLDTCDLVILEEISFDLKDSGEVKTRPILVPLRHAIKHIFKLNHKHYAVDLPDFRSKGWLAFTDSVDVRNRITHPRQAGDLAISEDEAKNLKRANLWIMLNLLRWFTKIDWPKD